MALLDERLRGILKEYLAAPIPRLSILMGNAASTVTKALFQAAIILLVGALMGARVTGNPLDGAGAAGAAHAVHARVCRRGAGVRGALEKHHGLPRADLPVQPAAAVRLERAGTRWRACSGWIKAIALANPTTYLIDALRGLAFGGAATIALPISFGVTALFATLGMALALWSFRQAIR